jgi:hypothetical protein
LTIRNARAKKNDPMHEAAKIPARSGPSPKSVLARAYPAQAKGLSEKRKAKGKRKIFWRWDQSAYHAP